MQNSGLKRIAIDPVTRVEGHGKITILLDKNNKVAQTRFHTVEFRGFERFIRGRLLWEIPVIAQRMCGICPVSHHLTAAKAMDIIEGIDRIPPVAEKIRRLMHYGQMLQSHATHFFYLASPDILFGFDAAPTVRNISGVLDKFPEFAHQGIFIRKFGQEIIRATAGKRIHGTGAVPGGVNKNLSIEERDEFIKDIDRVLDHSEKAAQFIRDFTLKNMELSSLGMFRSNHLCIVKEDGAMDLYDGKLRAVSASGECLFDQVEVSQYHSFIAEEVLPWSYMKSPFIMSMGPQSGWYRVGPLARMNCCTFIDTPKAECMRKEFRAQTDYRPCNRSLWYHWARMIEMLHAAEKIKELLNDPELQGRDIIAPRGERREEAVAVLEAPRGTLIHHYRVDKNDQVTMANLIVPTTHNNEPMSRAVKSVVEQFVDEKPEITEPMLNQVEVVVRAYDPCLSCSTHAMGKMPLVAEIYDCKGNLVQRVVRRESD